ncbi:MAG: hypothetical protein ACRDHZ_21880, partial [Ktedonobacteraceae bacterium]
MQQRKISGKEPDTLQLSVGQLTTMGKQYFLPEAMELLRRTGRKQYLTDDEVLLLAITGLQAARAHHVESSNRSTDDTLTLIANILDHEEVIRAEYNKLYALFRTPVAAQDTS